MWDGRRIWQYDESVLKICAHDARRAIREHESWRDAFMSWNSSWLYLKEGAGECRAIGEPIPWIFRSDELKRSLGGIIVELGYNAIAHKKIDEASWQGGHEEIEVL